LVKGEKELTPVKIRGPVRPLYTSRHSREGGNPAGTGGIPAFAGMTTVKTKPVDLTGPINLLKKLSDRPNILIGKKNKVHR
jgi:hypothetical protein